MYVRGTCHCLHEYQRLVLPFTVVTLVQFSAPSSLPIHTHTRTSEAHMLCLISDTGRLALYIHTYLTDIYVPYVGSYYGYIMCNTYVSLMRSRHCTLVLSLLYSTKYVRTYIVPIAHCSQSCDHSVGRQSSELYAHID